MDPHAPSILVVDDTPANLSLLCGMLKERGYRARPVPSGDLALQAAWSDPPDLVLLDIGMPEMDGFVVCSRLKADARSAQIPVIFLTAHTETSEKVRAFAVGGVDYVTKPFQIEEVHARVATHLELCRQRRELAIALDNALAYQRIADLNRQLEQEKVYLEDEIRHEGLFDKIVGRSAALRRVLKQIETVAATDSTVLVEGETGSGKELVARAIHDLGARKSKTFVKLNCAAIPTGLLESELFGHKRGAFTGAIADRVGRFELAHGGTVFLDEIGEIPLELQPKLLRVLQEREFERIGSSHTLKTDARLIAATNRDLSTMVDENEFRADLFYRLNVFPIRMPPLRERREDIPLLVRHFVQQLGRKMNRKVETISAEAMDALTRYDWPGNVRELQNLVERALIVSSGPVLSVPVDELKKRSTAPEPPANARTLEAADRAHILAVLEGSGWVLGGPNGAAERLGLKRSTLQFRMKKLGIEKPHLR